MCGYACINCGRCKGEQPKNLVPLLKVPGYCAACGTLNGPTTTHCKNCKTCLHIESFINAKRS